MIELAQALWLLVAAGGLALSVSYAGLPVLGQAAFVAVGGFGTALLGPGGAGWPLGLAALAATALAGLLGLLVALGASRLQGAYLALGTFALGWLVERLLTAYPGVFGGEQGLVREAPARLVSPALGLELVLTPAVHVGTAGATAVLLLVALRRLDRGPGGLDLVALREGPEVAASLGVPVAARRRAVLATTAALGGLSGAGTAVLTGLVAAPDVGPLLSLQLFVAVLVGGTARWWGPVLGVAVLTALPEVADLLATALALPPERARGVLTAALLAAVVALRARPRRLPEPVAAVPAPVPPPRAADWTPVLLRAQGVRHAFGAVQALDGVDLVLRGGEVHAVVGPNGSGKSTLLAVLAGDVRPDEGAVEVAGSPRPAEGPRARVLSGVARTPQRTALLAGSTARRQVAVGARGGSDTAAAVLRDLLATPSSRRAAARRRTVVERAMATCGIALPDAVPALLPTGQQRLLQVARTVATGAGVLLLDEPAAGTSAAERAVLVDVLRSLAGNGAAVLLVEHDMRLVAAAADRVTVLDRGRVLASGTPEQVRADPAVRRAYLLDAP